MYCSYILRKDLKRTSALLTRESGHSNISKADKRKSQLSIGSENRKSKTLTLLEDLRERAGYSVSCLYVFLSLSTCTLLSSWTLFLLLPRGLHVYGFGACLLLPPILFLGHTISRIKKRDRMFAQDFPSVLMATASSVKVGLTPFDALSRSVRLLPVKSLVRSEVELLMNSLSQGVDFDTAVNSFGLKFSLPELALFRRNLLLVLRHGGRFAPSLERLARVTRDRLALISQAQVSTTTMRMTAVILLAMAPVFLFILSFRDETFWIVMTQDSRAYTMGSIGGSVILLSIIALRRMSDFKP